MKSYDYIIVGAGLYGAVCAQQLVKKGKSVLVIEKRNNIGGNIYTENIEGINVHKYGAHIFHTSDKEVWDYVSSFAVFNNFINSPVANYKGEIYDLPFNMNTFSKMFGIVTPDQARECIEKERTEIQGEPENLEQQAISLVGRTVYTKLIKGYTEKQWGRDCKELPAFIIRRIPVRYTYDNNYFNDRFQGIPEGGYTAMIEKMFKGADIMLGTDFLSDKEKYLENCTHCIYTGPIDAFYDYSFGPLEYRSLRFETEILDKQDFQGLAVMNFTEREVPYTRIIEHKHFEFGNQPKTVITKEYPLDWHFGDEPYYPVNDDKNSGLYKKYENLSASEKNVSFGGRLAQYKYYDMDDTVRAALDFTNEII
jgi:UDP-galactopyranose mutase